MDGLLGGLGTVVEIDECKIGSRKFERGRLREGSWGYTNLSEYGYVHLTVNHFTNFLDPKSGVYTQNIESSCRVFRARLTRGGIKEHMLADHM
ncbi:uncharacterized protein LOC143266581, partial [Megachile rotundata]|uniref:uncharacterized protein LOC143266581 n=1 Tax=Megachile rotundata TaxID=143995 RepID=UPI003FD47E64